jgi:uncharacterized protein (TIGR03437 family)
MTFAGVFQINVRVPEGAAGEQPVRLVLNGQMSQTNVLLAVEP